MWRIMHPTRGSVASHVSLIGASGTGHWPMITRPAELADLLDKTARG